jgi:hypothetical protein
MGNLIALLPFARDLLARLFPDPAQRAEAEQKLETIRQSGELAELAAQVDLAKGQLEVNKIEAAHASVFVAGWRPALGWVIVGAIGFKYIAGPGVQFLARYAGHDVALPDIDAKDLWPLLVAMLGIAPPIQIGRKP